MTVILPILFIVATLISYLYVVPRMQRRRTAVTVTKGPDLAALFDVAGTERELKRPLADIIAEAERKAIAGHSPLAGDARQVELFTPPVRHPFDPCYLPNCPEARSQHEHVEVLGAGQYIVPLQPKANLGRRGGKNASPDPFMPSDSLSGGNAIEVTAFGDREPQFLYGNEIISETELKLRDMRQEAWAEAKHLVTRAEVRGGTFTIREQHRWDQLNEQLDVIDRRLEAIQICRRNHDS